MEIEHPNNQSSQLENYTMLTVIGKGGYAKVLLVKKNDDGQIYAMKILKKKFIGSVFSPIYCRAEEADRAHNNGAERAGVDLAPVHREDERVLPERAEAVFRAGVLQRGRAVLAAAEEEAVQRGAVR